MTADTHSGPVKSVTFTINYEVGEDGGVTAVTVADDKGNVFSSDSDKAVVTSIITGAGKDLLAAVDDLVHDNVRETLDSTSDFSITYGGLRDNATDVRCEVEQLLKTTANADG